MPISALPTRDLLGVYRDPRLASPASYWRDLTLTGGAHFSTRQEIIFEEIKGTRKIAPFVRPANTGKATYRRDGSRAKLFRPAYMKPKDSVVPGEQFSRQPGDLFSDQPRTPQQNFDTEVATILIHHRDIIERGWEWMTAMAAIYSQVTVVYEDGSTALVDYDRDPNLTVIKAAGFWSDVDYPILDDINAYADAMAAADFGGIPNRITVGSSVASALKKNKQVLAEMSTMRRGNTELDIRSGITLQSDRNENVRYLGTVGSGIDVYQYADFYQNDAGVSVPIMNTKDIVLTTPNVDGVMAFGAIVDVDAQLQPVAVFPKMWKENDPSAMFIMTQSAPLPIMVSPNRTMRARVLA